MQIARAWRQQPSNLRLVGSRCASCGKLSFPERIRCDKCGSTSIEEHGYCGRGTVFAVTTVHEAPHGFVNQVPYLAALVKLEEGPMVATMLTDVDAEDVTVGMEVSMVTRRLLAHGDDGPIVYAYKFAPPMETR